VVISGCGHRGIVEIVRAAKGHARVWADTVVGGFHMAGASRRDIGSVIAAFKEMGVSRIAPARCSGDESRRTMEQAFGEGYLPAGAGARFSSEPQAGS